MDYSNFEVEDFASDEHFIRWVVDNDAEAALFWKTYALNHPETRSKMERARLLLMAVQRAEDDHNTDRIARTWANIQSDLSKSSSQSRFSVYRIAASLSLIVIVSLLWKGYNSGYFSGPDAGAMTEQDNSDGFIEKENTSGRAITLHLADGSVVSLENNSRLRYFSNSADQRFRIVYLTGEAFFDIAKNRQQPFIVYANEVVTKVLGTSFRVKAYDEEEKVVVSVKEGKVSVYSAKSERKKEGLIETEVNGVVLMPNQQVSYERKEDTFNKTLVESPEIIKKEALHFNFEFRNTPVRDVFEVLSEAYGVNIIYDEEGLENCYLTVALEDEPLFEKLKIICRTISATYELIDANIVISSKGCG